MKMNLAIGCAKLATLCENWLGVRAFGWDTAVRALPSSLARRSLSLSRERFTPRRSNRAGRGGLSSAQFVISAAR